MAAHEDAGKKGKKRCAGETMAEVLVSALIFLLFMALLQSAVSFSSKAQLKSQEIRADFATICRELQASQPTGGTEAALEFYATDGTTTGDKVFSVEVKKQTIEVTYDGVDGTAGKTARFYVYGTK